MNTPLLLLSGHSLFSLRRQHGAGTVRQLLKALALIEADCLTGPSAAGEMEGYVRPDPAHFLMDGGLSWLAEGHLMGLDMADGGGDLWDALVTCGLVTDAHLDNSTGWYRFTPQGAMTFCRLMHPGLYAARRTALHRLTHTPAPQIMADTPVNRRRLRT